MLNRFSDTPKIEGEDIFESSKLSTAVVPKKNTTALRLLLTLVRLKSYRPTLNFSGTLTEYFSHMLVTEFKWNRPTISIIVTL